MPREAPLDKFRNIGIISPLDAGKTTTVERILHCAGRIRGGGEVSQATTTTDWMPQERERGLTITAAATFCKWKDFPINIIDTPGHADFTAEVERSLRVLDGAVVCIDGVQGAEPRSETVWRQADKYRVPRIIYINKMDRPGADFHMSYESIIKRMGANAVPIQLPIGSEADFAGVIDLIKLKALIWKGEELGAEWAEAEIPAEMREQAGKHRARLVEKLAEFDESLKARGDETNITPAELRTALRNSVIQARIFPVLCGSSYKNKGIQPLLDAICDYLPSPLDLPPIQGRDILEPGKIIERKADDAAPFSALIFKIQIDPFVGRLIFFRVYSGTLKAGDTVMFGNNRNTERIGRILRMHADQREEIKEIHAGDIGATVALKNARVGYTMCDQKNPVLLEQITFPEPVISVAIEPKTKADEEKLAHALSRLGEEDQTFRIKTDVETGRTIISGMGELHLEIIVGRMKREFNVEANVGKPRVAYRETIRKTVTEEGKFIRQSGGRGQYGHCVLKIEPQAMGKGFEFFSDVKQDRIPREHVPSVEKGVREALEGGALAGFPIVDIKVTLLDGSYHDRDSNEMAFKICGAMALRSGCKKADPRILEPIMKCEVTTPEKYAGDVIGDLNSRRAKISEMGDRGRAKFVRCTVPLSEMFGYAAVVRSISQGRASFTMEPSHYEEVPTNVWRASIDPHSPDEPPTASAGRPVRPIRPKPGLSGGNRKPFPPQADERKEN